MKKKLNLKNETVVITMCDVFSSDNWKVGKGYTIQRQNGTIVPVVGHLHNDNPFEESIIIDELRPGDYRFRYLDKQYLAVVSWVVQ